MSTVSHVLNKTHYVSPELTARVLAAVNELDYRLNPVARSLAGGRTGVMGLLLPDLTSYSGAIVRGIEQELAEAGYELMLHTTHNRTVKEPEYVSTLTRGLTEGLLLLLPTDPGAYLAPLRRQQFPYVVIDHQGFDDFSPTVTATNWQGAYDAVRYLIDLGHHRIGFIAGASHTSSAAERLNGYRAALEQARIPVNPALIGHSDFFRTRAYEATLALLALPEPPTAIFAANDLSAFGAMDAIHHLGLRFPDDVSVIGFDDIPEAGTTRPALTTVRQPLHEMGRTAARMLLEYVDNPQLPTRRVVLDTELIIRKSCQALHGIG